MKLILRTVLLTMVAWYGPAAIAADEDDAWRIPPLPAFKTSMSRDWYPDAARSEGLEGRVLVAFDIAADGRVRNPSVIWSENGVFNASALGMLKETRFSLPADWASSGAHRRWRLGFVFRLKPSGQHCDFAIPTESVFITGSRLPGAPVRTAPEKGSNGSCPTPPAVPQR